MDDQQLLRYSRHVLLNDFGIAGQERLMGSHVLIIGAGGLGCAVAMYLASAGIGQLTVCDGDQVEMSNLQRQVLHRASRIGMNKALSAQQELADLNPECQVTAIPEYVDGALLDRLVQSAMVVVEASDHLATRHAVNRACVRWKTPLVSGAAIQWVGQLAVFDARQPDSPCYACFVSEQTESPDLSCSETGIVASVTGTIGTMQATEVLRLLVHDRSALCGRMLLYDAINASWQDLMIPKKPTCSVCQPADSSLADSGVGRA
jgi:molybdopterin-synthase adenylyltransferase